MARDVILTCAVTGAADTTGKSPFVPVTPEDIANSAIGAARAGAAVVHIHVRNPETGKASMELACYQEVSERIRGADVDVLLNLTTGPGCRFNPDPENPTLPGPGTTITTPKIRTQHITGIKPDICSLDIATMNFGESGFLNIPRDLREMARLIHQAGVLPELEVFDLGHIRLAVQLIKEGALPQPKFFQLCLGVPWGAPANERVMELMRDMLPEDAVWSAFGIGPAEFPMAATSVRLGGHCRVGLEDNLYLEKGVLAQSNAALVERAVDIIQSAGGKVASVDRAREILFRRN